MIKRLKRLIIAWAKNWIAAADSCLYRCFPKSDCTLSFSTLGRSQPRVVHGLGWPMGWVGLCHGSEMADLRKTDVVYITTYVCNFALGSNNTALWKFAVWRITASSLYGGLVWLWVGLGRGFINSPGSGLGWVWVDEMDPWTSLSQPSYGTRNRWFDELREVTYRRNGRIRLMTEYGRILS